VTRVDARLAARRVLGSSYPVSKRYAQWQMRVRTDRRIFVFTMGKTGSTALSRAIASATGERVFQVFRLNRAGVAAAEQRFRTRVKTRTFPFTGSMHLWESQFLLAHPPSARARWDVVTSVREPVGQAVSAFFHANARDGRVTSDDDVESLRDQFLGEGWLDRPMQWFEREFLPSLNIDVFAEPFNPAAGTAIIERDAVRLLLVRQENFAEASGALSDFLRTRQHVDIAPRNTGRERNDGPAYGYFLERVMLPAAAVDETYASPLSRHFYSDAELAHLRSRWTGVTRASSTHGVRAHAPDVPHA